MTPIAPDRFTVGRVAALQPEISLAELSQEVQGTDDAVILNNMFNLILLWAQAAECVPEDFGAHYELTELERQPLVVLQVHTQTVARHTVAVEKPYDNSGFDGTSWSTMDLFEGRQVRPLEFPTTNAIEIDKLPGNEEVRKCPRCKGAGRVQCVACQGARTHACPTCDGVGQNPCPGCNGSGLVMRGGSGQTIECKTCGGVAVVPCPTCKRTGQVTCELCEGKGDVECDNCAGKGALKRHWDMRTEVSTRESSRPLIHDPWPIRIEDLFGDTKEIWRDQWAWPLEEQHDRSTWSAMPEWLVATTDELVRASLDDARRSLRMNERVTGIAVTVSVAFVFKVTGNYKGQQVVLFVGGQSNRVFPMTMPVKRQSTLARFRRGLRGILSLVHKGLRQGPDQKHLAGVRDGTTHVSDWKCLISDLATQYQLNVRVTSGGYILDIPATNSDCLQFHVNIEVISSPLTDAASPIQIIRSMCRVGPAYRDEYPKLLAFNQRLHFGRLGICADRDGDAIWFVDSRFYDWTDPDEYVLILKEAASVLCQLIGDNASRVLQNATQASEFYGSGS